MTGKELALRNIDTMIDGGVNAWASYAKGEINDPYNELDEKVCKVETALQELYDFINEH